MRWGYYVGGGVAKEEYEGDRYEGEWYWFRPFIMKRLVENAGLTQKQIIDCLTSDVRSHEQLRNRLISRYGKKDEITQVFKDWGF